MPASLSAAAPAPRQAFGANSPYYHWWIAGTLMLGFTTAGLSVTVVNLAFPTIMTSLRADLDEMQWMQTGSMIMQAVMMPSVGWLGARLGNRRLYLLSLSLFVFGSILCGFAWDVYSLIVFRLIQAIGSGPLFPLTQTMLFQIFPEEKRGLAMGVSSLGFSFGPMVGPVIGGYLIEYANWRSVFYINVPVGILGVIMAYLVLPTSRRQERRRLDVPGLLTMATFLVSFLLAVSQGREEGWDSPYIVTLLSIALVTGVSFVCIELRSPQPFVELRLFKNLPFAMASIVVFLNTLCFMAANFIVTLFLQVHLDYTPLQAAWILMPSAIVIGILSVVTGRLSDIVSPKLLVIFGTGAVALCMWQHTTITPWTSTAVITFWLTVRGVARAFTIAPLTTASMAPLAEAEMRMGSGLLSLNRGIASASSVALAAAVFQHSLATRTQRLVQDQSLVPFGSGELLQDFTTTFESLGDFSQMASIKAMAMLDRLVTLEAALHSYHDTFLVVGLISAAAIIPALWMGKRKVIAPQPSPVPVTPGNRVIPNAQPTAPPTNGTPNGATTPAAQETGQPR